MGADGEREEGDEVGARHAPTRCRAEMHGSGERPPDNGSNAGREERSPTLCVKNVNRAFTGGPLTELKSEEIFTEKMNSIMTINTIAQPSVALNVAQPSSNVATGLVRVRVHLAIQ